MTLGPLLDVQDLVVDYRTGHRHTLRAVDGVNLAIDAGETVGLVGESGSGKTTIGNAIVGLTPVTAGRLIFAGEDITHAGHARRARLAAEIQMVFQDPIGSLNPARTIGQTLLEPFLAGRDTPRAQRATRIADLLDRVGLPADTTRRYPAQLSGGQRQRVAIARALMREPRLVVCDEPVSALDLSIQAQILNLLADLRNDLGLSYLFIAHNLSVVRHLASRLVVLYRGRVMESGQTEAIYAAPAHPYTRMLLASAPTADPAAQRALREQQAATSKPALPMAPLGAACVFAARCPFAVPRCIDETPQLSTTQDGRHVACLRAGELEPGGAAAAATHPLDDRRTDAKSSI
jgi:peptide/nickel transport system ATP-binding protein